jgi:hypothetical protein
MRIGTALKRRDALCNTLRSIYATAGDFGLASTDLHSRTQAAYAVAMAGKAPTWIREYADGYRKSLMDAAYRHELVFGGFDRLSGKFYSTHRDRVDYYEKNGIEPCAYADDGRITKRGHYWSKSVDAGNPAPFFIG